MKRYLFLMLIFGLQPAFCEGEKTKEISLLNDGKKMMTYNVSYLPSPDKKAPWFGRSGFIHPVYSPKGRVVTDGFPVDKLHQHALMFAWTKAEYDGKPVDFWNSKKRQGVIEHVKTLESGKDGMKVLLHHVFQQKGEKPLVVLKETWDIRRVEHDSMHVFDLTSTQECATDLPLKLPEYHYGGMCVRGAAGWDSGKVMLTSDGKSQADGNHTRPKWVTIFGKVDGEDCGIAAMCHPDNFRFPQPVRLHPKMPYFCFAPMVLGDFSIEPGKPYVSRYRFVSFDGKPSKEALEAIWNSYSAKSKKGTEVK